MWTLLRFMLALGLAYFIRRALQFKRDGHPTVIGHVVIPNVASAAVLFGVISLIRNSASDGNYSLHWNYTLTIILLSQAVWLAYDVVRLRTLRRSRR